MPQRYIKKILDARVYDVAIETPLTEARNLSKRLGNTILLKREDLQPVFSFKIRGAYNRIAQLSEEQKARGVICASAGNHAQGVALAARKLGIRAVIVMPQTTPDIKVKSVRDHGARVVLKGDAFDEAAAHAQELIQKHGYTYIPPYDDPDVIAGQGTVAMEMMWQFSQPLHAVFIPVGGGGLIAGMAAYIKYLRPDIKVIGVEPEDSNCLQAALRAGERVVLDDVGIFADGVAVRQIGEEPWNLCKDRVDEVITVGTDEICAAIKDVFEDTRSIAEPAGALSVAGLKRYVEREGLEGENLAAVLSGANMNFDRLRYISERTEIGERREAILAVTIPEQPGAFKTFINALHKRSITEFNYRYADARKAVIFVGIQIQAGGYGRDELVQELRQSGYSVVDLTDSDLAKQHIRHMVGGHAPTIDNEKVYQFEFPERPGALLKFLMSLGTRWNISMFHYRNHGAAYSRVLLGAQVNDDEQADFEKMLDKVGFRYENMTDNEAYRLFLGAGNGNER
ncbi:threonine ammonia-lyase, biosynthetic [Marinobacter lutaoensis]|jgi:threonine dehydratase|uniref:L-threonine dehydratase n=1 Tax=Marinobacter lutaoensis TaxID=135739 RepID=A0A1V2DS86_9GAMM|nr:threonine ammonia-lyase, biosynthetic [Marinobacter lutaoensis]MBE02539.1 threonine ammonia-lyase, biosynthetic [Marinobacter sp.]MBI43666.1 threonine ammonia-lyase, biosynthetic [Oceanospirillales bacterium]NVD36246.1 threonine ammonia-lyase, biosynthetic [Marinobacter lutaoensis]ONF43389.1 threonine ammonia-lyase, biosynthetic [Marinobacter lutaoensis]|tara:strand:+ start:1275 stop:2810 length:1536 start_codon:yes stop_codon:yes gene_type:complete